jgi:hypothetical protein
MLRRDIELRLAAHERAGTFMQSPPHDLTAGAWAAATDDAPPAPEPGLAIGPYKLLERIGEGGMGRVYMAEQVGGAINIGTGQFLRVFDGGTFATAGYTLSPGSTRAVNARGHFIASGPGIAGIYGAGSFAVAGAGTTFNALNSSCIWGTGSAGFTRVVIGTSIVVNEPVEPKPIEITPLISVRAAARLAPSRSVPTEVVQVPTPTDSANVPVFGASCVPADIVPLLMRLPIPGLTVNVLPLNGASKP